MSFSRRTQFAIALYYLSIFVYTYFGIILIYYYITSHVLIVNLAFAIRLITVLTFSLLAYIVYRLFQDKPFTSYLGFRREGLFESLVLSSASFALPNLLLAIAYLALGMNPLNRMLSIARECSVPSWFNHVDSRLLPFLAILFWFLGGIISFVFLQSFPIKVLSKTFRKFALPIISILFILYYNMPLLTGEWKFDDIIFLGIIFPIILYKYGNSIGLILTYTFLYEMPVRTAFLRGWGEQAFWILVSTQIIWGIISIVLTFTILLKTRKTFLKKNRSYP